MREYKFHNGKLHEVNQISAKVQEIICFIFDAEVEGQLLQLLEREIRTPTSKNIDTN